MKSGWLIGRSMFVSAAVVGGGGAAAAAIFFSFSYLSVNVGGFLRFSIISEAVGSKDALYT